MAKIITTFAMSLDNYIADTEGGYSWIKESGTYSTEHNFFSFEDLLDHVDYIVMGNNSYKEGMHKQFPNHSVIVVTNNPSNDTTVSFESNIKEWLEMIKTTSKSVYIFGGAKLIDSIRNDIDEWIIGVVPTMLGAGRKIFQRNEQEMNLILVDHSIQNGIVLLKYHKR